MASAPEREPTGGQPAGPTAPRHRRRAGRGTVIVELIRLAVVVLATAGALQLADALELDDSTRVLVTVVGAGTGYVLGGVLGRFTVGQIDIVERRLRAVSAGELVAGAVGAVGGLMVAFGLVWPVLLFGGKVFTLPIASIVVIGFASAGLRLGASRGGDLLRFVGATGRLPQTTRGTGATYKLLDTSALIDGRILDVCRDGFVEGTLVVPTFVLHELQGLADAGDQDRRRRGKRGLDVLTGLQRSSGVSLEVTEDDPTEIAEVDAKLVELAHRRGAALVTTDANLARVAEVQGIRVLNVRRLADDLRPPVLPGESVTVRISKPGRETGQGVGYMDDGTMVVVEGARDRQGQDVEAEVTSILSNPNGRMVFSTLAGRDR